MCNQDRGPGAPKADTEAVEVLSFRVRKDLYRAFRRCVWMTIHETGMTQDEVHNVLIEELLRARGG